MIGGFFQALALLTLYLALTFISGPLAIIILFSHTLMLLFYMAWRGDLRLDSFTVATTVVALSGLALFLDVWHTQSYEEFWGILLSFVAAMATASRMYIYGHQTQKRHPIIVGAENFLVAAALVSLSAFYRTPHAPVSAAGYGYAVLGCGAIMLGTFAMFYGIAILGSFRWSLYAKMEPIFTSLFSAYFLKEVLRPQQYLGVLVVLGSLALYQIVEQRRTIQRHDGPR